MDSRVGVGQHVSVFANDWASGAASGSIAKVIASPFERAKLLVAVPAKPPSVPFAKAQMQTFSVILRVVREQGVVALWRGSLSNLLRFAPTQGFHFAFAQYFRCLLRPHDQTETGLQSLAYATGGAAGGLTCALVHPFDAARARCAQGLRMGSGAPQVRSLSESLRSGPMYDWPRFAWTLPGAIVYRALYFGLYDTGVRALGGRIEVSNVVKLAIANVVVLTSTAMVVPWEIAGQIAVQNCLRDKTTSRWKVLERALAYLRRTGLAYVRPRFWTIQTGAMTLVAFDSISNRYRAV